MNPTKTVPDERGDILVVDDQPAGRKLLSDLLTQAGYRVRPANSGALALASAAAKPPELIVLDINMPAMDGYEVCRRLKEQSATRDIPVLFISALNETQDKINGFAAGGVDFITKPFQTEEVLARVRTHLALYRLQHGLERQVAERTAELARANAVLREEINERARVEAALREREEHFRVAFHANPSPQLITRIDDGTIVDANAAYERLVGYPREELVGRRTSELAIWVALDRTELLALLKAQGRLREYPLQVRTKAGAVRDLMLSMEPIALGERHCFLSVMLDDTERLAAERALARSERMFKELVQSVKAVVWEADAQTFAAVFVSEQAEKLLGYPAADWLAAPTFWADHIHPADRAAAIAFSQYCVQTSQDFELEYRMLAADGAIIWLRTVMTVEAAAGAPRHLRGVMVDVTAGKHTEDALRESEARFRAIFARAPIGIALIDMDGRAIDTNPALEILLGYKTAELRAMTFAEFTHAEDIATEIQLFNALTAGKRETYQMEKRYLRQDGQVVWSNVRAALVRDAQGAPHFVIGMIEDISERRRIEAQYRQAQKMEAIGRLAGGVAHDFNNLLTVILGNTELLLGDIEPDNPSRMEIEQIREVAERAASLTRQLLVFSRQQVLRLRPINLNSVVANVEKLLQRLIGEDVMLITRLAPDLGQVYADPSQLEQVLLNLAVNARDAMPNGGTLIIETSNTLLDESYAYAHGSVTGGVYCLIAVSDSGCGMDAAVQSHIFEPFFTTKEQGKGTGLGLALVYGIVQQSGGYIWVYSEPGYGTTFKLYLPHVSDTAMAAMAADDEGEAAEAPWAAATAGAGGTILLVEDEPLVRALAARILHNHGYRVLEARDGVEALRVAADHPGPIDLLLTDVIMPGGMSGPQVAERLIARRQGLRVLYISGYTAAAVMRHTNIDVEEMLLQKPFTAAGLARAVWRALRNRPAAQPPPLGDDQERHAD